jgi:hypothetical protein
MLSLVVDTARQPSAEPMAAYRPGRMIRCGEPGYQRCTVTLMDTTDPEISFNPLGVSNWATGVFDQLFRGANCSHFDYPTSHVLTRRLMNGLDLLRAVRVRVRGAG